MSEPRSAACIDCGQPVQRVSYRCQSCSSTERLHFQIATGRRDTDRSKLAERNRAIAAEKAARRLADIDADIELGIDPDRIAADQGTTRLALERFAWRHDRPDLVAFFHVIVKKRNLRGTCGDCGGPCQHNSRRCMACHRRAERGWAA